MSIQTDSLDLIWEAGAIAAFIGRPTRATYHLLEQGALPAKVVGGRWCASRAALRAFFVPEAPDNPTSAPR